MKIDPRPLLAMLFTAGAALLLATPVQSQAKTFSFEDPKGVNNMVFVLDSEIEPIMGITNGISGSLRYDPSAPEKATGKIVVEAESVQMLNSRMTAHVHTAEWLDVEKHSKITFAVKKITRVKPVDGKKPKYAFHVTGDFALKGVTREITAPVNVTHLPGKLKQRNHRGEGDLLVLRTRFTINRHDFKVGVAMPHVADTVEVRVAIVGFWSAPER
jgi:polyisoprenoid-binding protein YceI